MKYQKTHPWISFEIDLTRADHFFWLQMGEIASKCETLSGVPLQPTFAKELHKIFLTKGVMATTAIEGNTLSEEQVRQQVDSTLKLPPSQAYLQQEIQNIISICNREVDLQIKNSEEKLTLCSELVCSYNRRVLEGLELEEGTMPGKLRNHSVLVGTVYRGAPAEDCPYLLKRLCEWLSGPYFDPPEKDLEAPYALLRAIVAHIYIAWIHPFGDGNGRTARLVEFHLLFTSGLPLPAAHLLSDHYNRTRSKYYLELDRASKSGGDILPFIKYAMQGFLDGIRGQIAMVRAHQMDISWENYVHGKFSKKQSSPTQKRRRELILELSKHDWISTSEIEMLTPRLAKAYAQAGDRMLQRDLNAVQEMELIERKWGKVRANKRVIQAFLPARID